MVFQFSFGVFSSTRWRGVRYIITSIAAVGLVCITPLICTQGSLFVVFQRQRFFCPLFAWYSLPKPRLHMSFWLWQSCCTSFAVFWGFIPNFFPATVLHTFRVAFCGYQDSYLSSTDYLFSQLLNRRLQMTNVLYSYSVSGSCGLAIIPSVRCLTMTSHALHSTRWVFLGFRTKIAMIELFITIEFVFWWYRIPFPK